MLNIISSSISTSIFFKNRRVEKKEGTVEARPIRYSILRLFSFTWEGGGRNARTNVDFITRCDPFRSTRDTRNGDCGRERKKTTRRDLDMIFQRGFTTHFWSASFPGI